MKLRDERFVRKRVSCDDLDQIGGGILPASLVNILAEPTQQRSEFAFGEHLGEIAQLQQIPAYLPQDWSTERL